MFEEVLSKEALEVLDQISSQLKGFYLAGGTGLALQIGHRRSYDLDFFSVQMFEVEPFIRALSPNKIFLAESGTLHFELKGITISLLFYESPLIFQPIEWKGIQLADERDIAAEKIKTISQRGAKKDFIDLYALLTKYSVTQVCQFFKKRFSRTNINIYHVVKSLIFFEDAEGDPLPPMLVSGKQWQWPEIKKYFMTNIQVFERELGVEL